MKFLNLITGIFLSISAIAQQEFNFTSNTLKGWEGDTSYFKVVNGELNSNGPSASAIISIATPLKLLSDYSWEFYVRLEFNPTTTNYAKVFLFSDNSNLGEDLKGYFVKIGGVTGNADAIDLYRQDGNKSIKIISGIPGHVGKPINKLRIKVCRYFNGLWQLSADTLGGTNFTKEGEAIDSTYNNLPWFGISCRHSSTRRNKFFFDDIRINQAPFSIISSTPLNDSTLKVLFNKIPSSTNASIFLNDIPINTYETNGQEIVIHRLINPGENSLRINNLSSESNETISNAVLNFSYIRTLKYGSLFINEILANPSHPVGLPEFEYLEIVNTTDDTINLKNFTLTDYSTIGKFPDANIAPGEFLIVCQNSAVPFLKPFGKTIGVSPWPSLNNSGDSITLKDNHNTILSQVIYSDSWHSDVTKKVGGYSLEAIDPSAFCLGKGNWKTSVDPTGGTPGKVNSIYNPGFDKQGPVIKLASIVNDSLIAVSFHEPIENKFADIRLNGLKASILILGRKDSLLLRSPFLFAPNNFYTVEINNLSDCLGNFSEVQSVEVLFPGQADSLDILINEILFNPFPHGDEFVEIYNNSDKYISLKDWKIASFRSTGSLNSQKISTENYILKPFSYLALSKNPEGLKNIYSKATDDNLLKIKTLPSFNNDTGTVMLYKNEKLMDKFNYKASYHFPLISSKQGVSLERISFRDQTNIPSNWHSASATENYATPGYKNSQARSNSEEEIKTIKIDPPCFSPDDDGYNDFTTIRYNLDHPGMTGSIRIFDSKGRLVKNLVNNCLWSREGIFQWDGTDEQNQKATIGIHIVLIELFDLEGTLKSFKETVVVGSKL